MKKTVLRRKYRDLRNSLTEDEISSKSVEIANMALKLPVWNAKCFHVFLPITNKKEVDTVPIITLLGGKDKNVAVSSADFDARTMTHFLLADDVLIKPNAFGIPEPQNGEIIKTEAIDVVFVPLLAFDLLGNRVGYGMGFYDRFLSDCRKDVVKVGLSFFGAEAVIDDATNDDIPLNYCVTPNEIYRF